MTSSLVSMPGQARIVETVLGGRLQARTFYIDAEHVEECAVLWRTANCTTLGISSNENQGLKSLDFLTKFENVQRVHLMLDCEVDLAPLQACANTLEHFFCNDDLNALSTLEVFPKLKSLGQKWRPTISKASELRCMQKMSFSAFSEQDLSGLPDMPELMELNLYQTKVADLRGIERFQQLSRVRVGRAQRLESADALTRLPHLTVFEVEFCRKLNPSFLQNLRNLQRLCWESSADLPDVHFLQAMPHLEWLNIMGSKVLNPNLSDVLQHTALKKFLADFKRNFACSEKEFLSMREGSVRSI